MSQLLSSRQLLQQQQQHLMRRKTEGYLSKLSLFLSVSLTLLRRLPTAISNDRISQILTDPD